MNLIGLRKNVGFLTMVLILSATLTAGCASRSKTTSTVDGNGTVVQQTTTTTTEDHHDGVIGSTFHVIGEIIAFPFEVIAGLFRAIF